MLKKIVLAVVAFVAVVLVYAAFRPDAMHIERSASVHAPADAIFPLINDFHSWTQWSPYEKKDPAMARTYSGAPSGRGAIYEWAGNSDVGRGRMEVTDSEEPSRIVIKLDFIEPFEGHNVATFTMTPDGANTRVTWAMDGPSPYVAKLMGIFVNMDTMIGADFEVGLNNLKAAAEK